MIKREETMKVIINRLIAGILFGILCGITLFVTSRHFVNQEVTPKWFGLIAGVGIAGIISGIFHRNLYIPLKLVFIPMLLCCSLIVLRDYFVSGFNYQLMTQVVCLLLLFFLLQQMTVIFPVKYILGIMVILTTILASYGVWEYPGLFISAKHVRLTGSFDNPAGFTAALVCVLPCTFYFFRNTSRTVKYIAVFIAILLFSVIVLSQARAAIIAGFAVILCYLLCGKYSGIKWKNWVKILLVCIIAGSMTGLYFLKKDSADGRIPVWSSTWEMIRDKPSAGHGYGTFNAKYMLYQAEYFETHPESKYADLADNVLHPFNEYLLVWAEHGIIGMGCIALLYFLLIRRYFREPSHIKFIALLSMLSLAVLSCFSYPFKYPFTWLIAFLNIALICPPGKVSSYRIVNMTRAGLVSIAISFLSTGVSLMKAEIRWNTIAKQSLMGRTKEVLPEYDKLYKDLGRNGLFLYNHAAELHEVKEYAKSLLVFERCVRYYNDMDVQMLLAYNYKELGRYNEAEKHLKLAASMCPGRFMPLYQLTELYTATERTDEARTLAQQIVDKKVKIPSATIHAIKQKMQELIDREEEINVPASESRTNVEPINKIQPRQGNLLENETPKELLPP
ncbi:MAG: O-antigen ligase family protein [Prevotellaceae bacterium]|jgi:tetratricopeptide (TPR) repeat protein|nr:O-antigen ligase family protein [Prevotellaceae bacterium]